MFFVHSHPENRLPMPTSTRFDNSVKEEILSRADIALVIGRYVALKPAGQNLKGLCPFHKEKTPSFSVNPARGFFHCFGCHKGGDVFTFLMEIEGITFPEALSMLGNELGIAVERSMPAPPEEGPSGLPDKTEMLRIHEVARQFYYEQIKPNQRAIDYFKQRGMKPEIVREFSLGYAPSGWSNLVAYARTLNISEQSLIACGLALTKSDEGQAYDRFRDRIMFPLFDIAGKCIAFAGRSINPEDMPKYLNSPETPIYHKSRTLYGLHKARPFIKEEGFLFIVEGYMDFLALYQAGIGNVVATSGTAFTADHAHLLRRFTSRTVLLFDGDAAGQKAAERAVFVLAPFGLDVSVLLLPDDLDPDDYIREHGRDTFLGLVKQAQNAAPFIIDKAIADNNGASPQGKSAAIAFLAPLMQAMSDSIVRGEFIKLLSERLDVNEQLIYERLKKQPAGTGLVAGDGISVDAFLNTPEGKCIRILALHPELFETAAQRLNAETFPDPVAAKLFLLMRSAAGQKLGIEAAARAEDGPDVRRILSAILVQSQPDENPEQELRHIIQRLERSHLGRRIHEITRMLKAETDPSKKAQLLLQNKELSKMRQELDSPT